MLWLQKQVYKEFVDLSLKHQQMARYSQSTAMYIIIASWSAYGFVILISLQVILKSNSNQFEVQLEPSHPVYSSARSPSIQFSQRHVTQHTVQLGQVTLYTVHPEPSHPVYSSARDKSPSKQFS